jgi:hypothetical protein
VARVLATAGPVAAGLLATAIVCYNLARPGGLHGVTQYDDGVYYGAAVRLIKGQLPYRDFTFVQPPGIAVWFAPIAWLTHAAGTSAGLAWARIITAVVAGLDAWLVGRLLRHQGAVAATVASLALAVYPAAFFADRTLLLEPYLVLFCLIAANVAFSDGAFGSRRRLLVAGVFLGCAGATKTWAAVVLAAFVLAALTRERRGAWGLTSRVAPLVAGAAVGFLLVCGPFFIEAPHAFVHDVVTSQLGRQSVTATKLWLRLLVITGLHGVEGVPASRQLSYAVAIVIAAVLVAFAVVPAVLGRTNALERFLLLATAGALGALLVPAQFYDHYAYFVVAFLAPALSGALVRGARAARGRLSTERAGWRRKAAAGCAAALGCAVIGGVFWLVPREVSYQTSMTIGAIDPAQAIDVAVPNGACVLSDSAILLVEANRLTSGQSGCPDLLDGTALWLSIAPGDSPESCAPVDPALVADWRSWLSRADFFVESSSSRLRVPWTVGLRAWFATHYKYLPDPGAEVFVHLGTRYAAPAIAAGPSITARLVAQGWRAKPAPPHQRKLSAPQSCLATRT